MHRDSKNVEHSTKETPVENQVIKADETISEESKETNEVIVTQENENQEQEQIKQDQNSSETEPKIKVEEEAGINTDNNFPDDLLMIDAEVDAALEALGDVSDPEGEEALDDSDEENDSNPIRI